MGSTLRFVESDFNTHFLQRLGHLFCTEVFIRTASHEEVVHLLVEFVGIGKHTIETILQVKSENGSTESSEIRELVQMRNL